jgi:hypothetical protein
MNLKNLHPPSSDFLPSVLAAQPVAAPTFRQAAAMVIGCFVLGLLFGWAGWNSWRHREPVPKPFEKSRLAKLPNGLLLGAALAGGSVSLSSGYLFRENEKLAPAVRFLLNTISLIAGLVCLVGMLAFVVSAFWTPRWAKTGMGNREFRARQISTTNANANPHENENDRTI